MASSGHGGGQGGGRAALLVRPGDEEDPAGRVPWPQAADGGGDGAAEGAEFVGRLVLVAEEAADVAEVAEQPLLPGREEVVRLHLDQVEAGPPQEAFHLGARVAELGEAEPLA